MTVTETLPGGLYTEQGDGAQTPTTDRGRKWLASAVSWAVHAVILAVIASGILPSASVVEPPPEMVVQMVAEPPPPPPPPPPEIAKPLPPPPPVAKAEPPKPPPPHVHHRAPAPPPQIKAPEPVQPPAPAPMPTAPSPESDVPKLPPVAGPVPAQPGPATAKPAPPSSAPQETGEAEGARQYLSGIQKLAQDHLVYPPLSLRRGEQGEIHVHVKVNRSGEVLSMDAGDEGTGRLRAAALEAIRESSPFPPLPASIHGDTVDIVVPVRFIISS